MHRLSAAWLTLFALALSSVASAANTPRSALERAVQHCSVVANPDGRTGPASFVLWEDDDGSLVDVDFEPTLRDTEFDTCVRGRIRFGSPSAVLHPRRVSVAFHAWAGRSRRSWPDVERHMRRRGFHDEVKRCVAQGEGYYSTRFTIALDGRVQFGSDERQIRIIAGDGTPEQADAQDDCLHSAASKLLFGHSGNEFVVTIDHRQQIEGEVGFPRRCAVEGRPCDVIDEVELARRYVSECAGADVDDVVRCIVEKPHARPIRRGDNYVEFAVSGPSRRTWFVDVDRAG